MRGPPELPLFRACSGLNQGERVSLNGEVPVDGGDDAARHGAPELCAQRISNGDYGVSHLRLGGISEFCRSQSRGVDVQDGQVTDAVLPH